MMKPLRFLFALSMAALLAWPVAARPKATVERDLDYDLARSHRFSVEVATPWGNEACEQRVSRSVATRLQAGGWLPSDGGHAPDIRVLLHGASKDVRGVHEYYRRTRLAWKGWGPRKRVLHPYEYTERTLVVDMFDASTQRLVWRGTAKGVASTNSDRNHARIERGLDRLFRNLVAAPPVL